MTEQDEAMKEVETYLFLKHSEEDRQRIMEEAKRSEINGKAALLGFLTPPFVCVLEATCSAESPLWTYGTLAIGLIGLIKIIRS